MNDNNPYNAPQADISKQASEGMQLASLGQRLAAALIDALLLSVVVIPILLVFFGGWSNYLSAATNSAITTGLAGAFLSVITYVLINGKFLNDNGQTVGKKLLGIKIVRTDGSRASLSWILTRRFSVSTGLSIVPFIGGLLSLVDVLLVFRNSRQCLHDTVADTKVVAI